MKTSKVTVNLKTTESQLGGRNPKRMIGKKKTDTIRLFSFSLTRELGVLIRKNNGGILQKLLDL